MIATPMNSSLAESTEAATMTSRHQTPVRRSTLGWIAGTLLAAISTPALAQNQEQRLDPAFGVDGRRTVAFDAGSLDKDVAIDAVRTPNGEIYLIGEIDTDNGLRVGIAKLDPSGNLDASFGVNGKAMLDLCMSRVRDALLLGTRILILGETLACGDGTRDGRIASVNSNGTLDNAFGNGGVVSFQWLAGENTADSVYSMVRNELTGQIVVAGSVYVSALNRELPIAGALSSVGALQTTIFGPSGFPENTRLVDVKRVIGGGYAFAVQRDGDDLASSGGIFRVDDTLSWFSGFGSSGYVGLREGNTQALGCSSSVRIFISRLEVMGGRLYALGHEGTGGLGFAYGMVDTSGGSRITECGGPRIRFVNASFSDTMTEDGRIYIAGGCNSGPSGNLEMCAAALRVNSLQDRRLEIDSGFNPGAPDPTRPIGVSFTAAAAADVVSEANFILRIGFGRTVIGGWRKWTFQDWDYAAARFYPATPLLRDGFEAAP